MNLVSPQARTAATGLKVRSAFSLIPRVDTFPAVVSFSQTAAGKMIMLLIFAVELRYFIPSWMIVASISLPVGFVSYMPEYRRLVLAVTPNVFLIQQSYGDRLLLGSTLFVITMGIALYWAAMRWPLSGFGRRPVVFLLTGFTLLIICACQTTYGSFHHSFLWTFVAALSSYVWFIAYALTDRHSAPIHDSTLELAAFRPLWGSSNTPFPKGAAYLRRVEARNPEQLAITQLKGLKLLSWAILLAVFSYLWNSFFHSTLRIPTSESALALSVQGHPVAWRLRWESLILGFFESILAISILGHRIIAICRFAGFNALRNTYRPLTSTTIAEFFNRYYYYFKELLVDLFFYPAFLRYWKGYRRFRIVFATFSAAFFGNAFFHFTRDWQIIRDLGLRNAFVNYEASLLYCFILATGLSISQLRKRQSKPAGFLRGRVLPSVWVCLFYCILNVLVTSERAYPLQEYLRYMKSLLLINAKG